MSVGSGTVNVVNAAAVAALVELVQMYVASAAVGPASGCETMGTGLRPGCTWRYSCLWWYLCCLSLCLSLINQINVSC